MDINWTSFIEGDSIFFAQAQWFVLAILAIITIRYIINLTWITNNSYVLYIISILVLLLTIFVSDNIRGSHSWLPLFGIIKVQPAEFSKIAIALCLAQYISSQQNLKKRHSQLLVFGIPLIPALLILAQRELGQALFFVVILIPLYRQGISTKYFYLTYLLVLISILVLIVDITYLDTVFMLGVCFFFFFHLIYKRLKNKLSYYLKAAGIIITLFATYHHIVPYLVNHALKPHHVRRIYSIIDIDNKTRDWMTSGTKKIISTTNFDAIKYNVKQAEIAIGSGGFWGKGFDNSTQMKFSFIPEQHTDFIFSSIGESLGIVGCTFILILYFLLICGILFLAERQQSNYARVFIYCVFSYLLFNICLNIGMVIGLFPVVGLPLPWLSYGGSSFISNSIMVALALKMGTQS